MVEDRPIIFVKYCLPVPVFHFWPQLSYPAARGLSAIAELLVNVYAGMRRHSVGLFFWIILISLVHSIGRSSQRYIILCYWPSTSADHLARTPGLQCHVTKFLLYIYQVSEDPAVRQIFLVPYFLPIYVSHWLHGVSN